MVSTLLQMFIFFAEPGFPAVDVGDLVSPVEGATVVTSVAQLETALQPGRVLVWRHGSAFPADAWPVLLRFLEQGGSLLYLGGEPFTRPVTGEPGQRVVQPRTVSLLKELRLNQCYRLPVGGARHVHGERLPGKIEDRTVSADTWVSILEPRLADTRDSLHEDGAPGARDAILRPLSQLHLAGGDRRFPAAAGSYAIDRLRGRFAGGRWVFYLLSTTPHPAELRALLDEARRPPTDFRVDPTFGCFHEGERPTVRVSLHRPGQRDVVELPFELEVHGPDGERWQLGELRLRAGLHGTRQVPLQISTKPGLYRVTARASGLEPFTSGFWIFDRELFESGDELTFDGYTMRRNGIPEPVVGTTTMSGSVHRKFLFEPNAAVWDDTFAELASLNVNFVRTGIWSAYRKISLDPHTVDEAWLRALEAYYLCARRHGIPILFTFFSFVPETFGGVNPYFDPRSIEGQQGYVSTVARRFARTREMLWDLINEPSFSSPEKLWKCRPSGDRYEQAAFRRWLRERYSEPRPPHGRDPQDLAEREERGWEDVVRRRWRLLPEQAIGLPDDADFEDRHHIGEHRPYRAREFSHFAQDAFEGWVRTLSRSIRNAGSQAAIVVGQDEGGLHERPHPLFHHRSVTFTSLHTWWYNDALLWDGVLAKAAGKPLLISETGVMQRELLSGESIRTPDSSARLLSRKVGLSFAAGAFGIVQWCYEVNPYMASDNEVAIGLKRVDGSYKPEHAVLREFAAFVARNKAWFEGYPEPEVVLVFPSADHYAPRGLQLPGTRRAVETLMVELGVPLRVVPEYRTEDLGRPRLIVLPACRGISQRAWDDVRRAVEAGAVLHCSGWFEQDDAGLPALRLGSTRRRLAKVEPGPLHFDLATSESAFACRQEAWCRELAVGSGGIRHHGLPVEWAQRTSLLGEGYAESLRAAGVALPPSTPPGIVLRALRFREATLWVAVNESSATRILTLPGSSPDEKLQVSLPKELTRMFLVRPGAGIVDRSGPSPGPR